MTVRVDEAGEEHDVTKIYDVSRGTSVVLSDESDAIILDGDDTVADGWGRNGNDVPSAIADHGKKAGVSPRVSIGP